MTDERDRESAPVVAVEGVPVSPEPVEAPLALAPAITVALVTAIAVDPVAREVAVQAAMASVKADAAVAQLDAVTADAIAPVEAPLAPAPAIAVQCGLEEPEPMPEPELGPMQRLEACEKHIEELVRHLAQSFGGEFAAKKERMGV